MKIKQASFPISLLSKLVPCHLALPKEVTLSHLANGRVFYLVKVDGRVLQ